jgi:hypothetical protein
MKSFRGAALVLVLMVSGAVTSLAMTSHGAYMWSSGGVVGCTASIAPANSTRLVSIWLSGPQGQHLDFGTNGTSNPSKSAVANASGAAGSGTYTCHVEFEEEWPGSIFEFDSDDLDYTI